MKRKQKRAAGWFRVHRRCLAFVLASALVCSMLAVSGNTRISRAEPGGQSAEGSHGLHNPVTDSEGITTWDCVYFGNYWQNDTNGDGVADKKDEKKPIKWRVLSVDGDDAFLLADKNLDVQRYHDSDEAVTWETCTMRSWLNEAFLENAFTDSEQAAIRDTNVVNADNPEYGAAGGNDTTDKVYLLSIDEVTNPVYGFRRTVGNVDGREAVNTAYVAGGGEIESTWMNGMGESNNWWLRSPGSYSNDASNVRSNGCGVRDGFGVNCDNAVRPALHLNLSSVSEWSYAGTVTVLGDKADVPSPSPEVTGSPSPLPFETGTPTPTIIPTKAPEQSEEPEKPTSPPSQVPAETGTPMPTIVPTKAPTQSEEPGKPAATPSQTPAVPQGTGVPVVAPGSQSETATVTAVLAVYKPGKVAGLKVKAKKGGIQARWKKCAGAAGYEVWYSTSKKFSAKKKKNVKTAAITIKKLKRKKTYYIRVRAFANQNGKKVYGAWSKAAKKKVK